MEIQKCVNKKMSAVFGVWLRTEQMHEKDRVLR